jgi:hypothetical protein
LIGELAEDVFAKTGKKTRLYSGDRGGTGPVDPYINLGIIEAISMEGANPWYFLHNAVRGRVKNAKGEWVEGDNSHIGLFAFEGIRSFAEALMEDMKSLTAKNVNIGGGANVTFVVTEGNQQLKIAGNNQTHFSVAQGRMTEEIWQSQLLPSQYVLWTSSVSKEDDTNASGKILGPDAIGRALTPELPRWNHYTMRVDVLPAPPNGSERHVLYLGTQLDQNAGNVGALGNMRLPKDGKIAKTIIEPASIVEALRLLEEGKKGAEDAIRKRLGPKLQGLLR